MISPQPNEEPSRLQIIRPRLWIPESLQERIRNYDPKSNLGRVIRDILHLLPGEQAIELLDAIQRTLILESALFVKVIRANGTIEDYGLVSQHVITTAGVGFLVDAWENLVEMENMKYHGTGSGSTAEASSDTALVTEFTTQLNPDSTRATGSLTESAANIFQTVGTNLYDAGVTVAEHGLFSQAATGGGVLWDRSLTGSIALSSGDSLQTTYNMTATAGG